MFKWKKVFATDLRKVVYAVTDTGLEFRDNYILSGKSLEAIGKEIGIEKLKGELDYEKVRTHKTELTTQELAYCYYDVKIILEYIKTQIKEYNNISNIPLTNTGRIRRITKEACFGKYKKLHGARKRYYDLMRECNLSIEIYQKLKKAFIGGFTHASLQYVNKLLINVASCDITSSYPAVICSEKFPLGRPVQVAPNEVNLQSNKYNYLLTVAFYDIFTNNTYESYISESKTENLKNGEINNGRVYSCDYCEMTITEIDLKIILKCYEIEKYEIIEAYKFYSNYLPCAIINTTINLFHEKNLLKGSDNVIEYNNKKSLLNSIYGMCVTDIIQNDVIYENDEWGAKIKSSEEKVKAIEKYNNSKKRFLYYCWGVWITAYARRNLWQIILSLKDDYVYSDTDSVKFLNRKKHTVLFNEYNNLIKSKIKKMCEFHKIDMKKLNDKKFIGCWDYEGTYDYFKTLGAKRYLIYENGKYKLTVAGLSKQDGVKYMIKKGKTVEGVFKFFNNKMLIPAAHTGKLTHIYIDEENEGIITDYKGNSTYVKSLSGIHLEGAEYSLAMSEQYRIFLEKLQEGLIYEGYY